MSNSYLSDFLRNMEALCPRYFSHFLCFFSNQLLLELQQPEIMILQDLMPLKYVPTFQRNLWPPSSM